MSDTWLYGLDSPISILDLHAERIIALAHECDAIEMESIIREAEAIQEIVNGARGAGLICDPAGWGATIDGWLIAEAMIYLLRRSLVDADLLVPIMRMLNRQKPELTEVLHE